MHHIRRKTQYAVNCKTTIYQKALARVFEIALLEKFSRPGFRVQSGTVFRTGQTASRVSITLIGRNERNFSMVQLGVGIWSSFFSDFVQVAEETAKIWSPGKPLELMKEMFRMTLKAILCTSLGNIFEDNSGIEWLANCYHLCKCEMNKRILEVPCRNANAKPTQSRNQRKYETCLKTARAIIVEARATIVEARALLPRKTNLWDLNANAKPSSYHCYRGP